MFLSDTQKQGCSSTTLASPTLRIYGRLVWHTRLITRFIHIFSVDKLIFFTSTNFAFHFCFSRASGACQTGCPNDVYDGSKYAELCIDYNGESFWGHSQNSTEFDLIGKFHFNRKAEINLLQIKYTQDSMLVLFKSQWEKRIKVKILRVLWEIIKYDL